MGSEITPQLVIQFHRLLENEIPFPYFLDMIHVGKIQNQALKAHIQTEGYVIYSVPDLVSIRVVKD